MLVAAALLAVLQAPGVVAPATAQAGISSGRLVALPDDAVAYIPAGVRPNPPILVLLHGAGQGRKWLIDRLRPDADRRGMVLLAPVSHGATWDAVTAAMRDAPPSFGFDDHQRYRYSRGKDGDRVEAAIAALGKVVAVDRGRTVLAGFSDGATFALTIGLQKAHPFAAVIAWSPGIPIPTVGVAAGRPAFISHGRNDAVTSFRIDALQIVPLLREEGAAVTFLPFDGGHEIPDAIRETVLNATIGAPEG